MTSKAGITQAPGAQALVAKVQRGVSDRIPTAPFEPERACNQLKRKPRPQPWDPAWRTIAVKLAFIIRTNCGGALTIHKSPYNTGQSFVVTVPKDGHALDVSRNFLGEYDAPPDANGIRWKSSGVGIKRYPHSVWMNWWIAPAQGTCTSGAGTLDRQWHSVDSALTAALQ
jgi:hypothetical protein